MGILFALLQISKIAARIVPSRSNNFRVWYVILSGPGADFAGRHFSCCLTSLGRIGSWRTSILFGGVGGRKSGALIQMVFVE